MNENAAQNEPELKQNLISPLKVKSDSTDIESNINLTAITSILKQPKKKFSTFRRLLNYTCQNVGLVIIGNIALIVNSLSQIIIPYLCGEIITVITAQQANPSQALKTIALEFLILSGIGSIGGFIRGVCYNLIGERIIKNLRNDLFSSLIDKDIEFYDSKKAGDLMSRLSSDTTVVQSSASDNISIIIRNIIQTIGSFVILWLLSWRLTIVLFLAIPMVVICVAIFAKSYKGLTKAYQTSVAESGVVASEAFGNIRVVKSFSKENKEAKQHLDRMCKTYIIGRKRAWTYGIFVGVVSLIANGTILSVLWFGGEMVIDQEMNVGDLASFILYTITLAVSLLSVNGAMTSIITSIGAAEQIFELMDYIPKVNCRGGKILPKFEGTIEIKDVDFNYPTTPEVKVLDNISLTINSGEVVAIVGASGSGKSSIISLIERFYDVTKGHIIVDGDDIKELDLRWYHDNIGYVSQEPSLFSGTLEENIIYGIENYTIDDIEKALKMANAYDFVMNAASFPLGLQTIVGDRGVKLSGGQKQRIAIARALIKNPKILIFDEATSALDADSEYQVQQAIDDLIKQGNKTVIIIAHRLSTIIHSPRIIVIQNGKIVEDGNHADLLNKGGIYKALIERQLSGLNV